VNRLQEPQCHTPVGGDLLVGAIQALGRGHDRRIQERQRQVPPIDQGNNRLDREPRRLPRLQQPRPPNLPGPEPRLLTRQRPHRDQPPHEALGDVRTFGNLVNALRHLGFSLHRPWAQ